MRKNPKIVENRARYVQKEMNTRHKSETAQMCAERLARELFLSVATIWNDFSKKLPVCSEKETKPEK